MTEQEALKRHKELWQGVIDYIKENWSAVLDNYVELCDVKEAVLESQGYEKTPLANCWLCEFYHRVCHRCPLGHCSSGSLFSEAENAYIQTVSSNDKTEKEKHYKEFIELAEKIRDIGDERIKE